MWPRILATLFVGTAYIVASVLAVCFPRKHMQMCEIDALNRGWSIHIIRMTRVTLYFTLYSQAWLLAALLTMKTWVVFTAFVLETTVFILYHGIAWYDPHLLAYEEDPEMLRAAMRWCPPSWKKTPWIIMWTALHLQHTVLPVITWILFHSRAHELYYHLPPGVFWYPLCALVVYTVFNECSWIVLGRAAYPIQETVYRKKIYAGAYMGVITLMSTISIGGFVWILSQK